MAIQASGDVNITQGMTATQMTEIMVGLAKQISIYQMDAEMKVVERLSNFREEILKEFSKSEGANSEAFRDPDFQFLLNRAQQAYVRSGDDIVGENLVQMISERSKEKSRTRLSLCLNQALETAAVLTENEFAQLLLFFCLRHTKNFTVTNKETFSQYFATYIAPFMGNVSTENMSYQYLLAQQCVTINHLSAVKIEEALLQSYGGVFSKGFTEDVIRKHLLENNFEKILIEGLVIKCLNDPNKLQFNSVSVEDIKTRLELVGLNTQEVKALCEEFQGSFFKGDELVENLTSCYAEFSRLKSIWDNTPLKQMTLTALGIVIGHANLKRVVPSFKADLGVWVK